MKASRCLPVISGSSAVRSSLRIVFSFLVCLCLAAQEGQEKSDSRDRNLPEKNPYDSAADLTTGRQYFLGHCAQCHGPEGEGGRGVNLTTGRYRHGNSDRQLYMTIRKGVPGSEMYGSSLSQPELWRVVAYVRRLGAAGAEEKAAGDPKAGQAIYEGKGGCASCHIVNGRGGLLGPDLTEIGLRRSLKFLRDSIVDPSAYINPEYRSATVVPRSGAKVRGVVLNEDDYSIQLRDTREELRSFLKSDLKEVQREKESLMPSYKSVLSETEINDLVARLNSLRGNQ
jgi:cytochrome c oxidase cbb3-type subunit III